MPKKFKTPVELFDLLTDFSNQICELANKKNLSYLVLMIRATKILNDVIKEQLKGKEDA